MRSQPASKLPFSLSLQWSSPFWDGHDAIRRLHEARVRIFCGCRPDETVSIEKITTSQLEPMCQFLYVASVLAMIVVDAVRLFPLALGMSFRSMLDSSIGRYVSDFLFHCVLGYPPIDCSRSEKVLRLPRNTEPIRKFGVFIGRHLAVMQDMEEW